jgi:hypothetical protein
MADDNDIQVKFGADAGDLNDAETRNRAAFWPPSFCHSAVIGSPVYRHRAAARYSMLFGRASNNRRKT